MLIYKLISFLTYFLKYEFINIPLNVAIKTGGIFSKNVPISLIPDIEPFTNKIPWNPAINHEEAPNNAAILILFLWVKKILA